MVDFGPSSLLALCCQFWVFELLELVCCWFAFLPRDSQLNDEELTGSCRPHHDVWSESCLCDPACRDVVFPAAGFCRISPGLTKEMSCHWWPGDFFCLHPALLQQLCQRPQHLVVPCASITLHLDRMSLLPNRWERFREQGKVTLSRS